MQAVLLAMAVALLLAFLVALRHAGDRPAAGPAVEVAEEPESTLA